MEKTYWTISPKKNQKVHLSMTGFEPAISRFVAERVIRCATWICCTFWLTLEFINNNPMQWNRLACWNSQIKKRCDEYVFGQRNEVHRGPFIYYVITFLGFLDPPPPPQYDKEADFKSNISLHLRVPYCNNFFTHFYTSFISKKIGVHFSVV